MSNTDNANKNTKPNSNSNSSSSDKNNNNNTNNSNDNKTNTNATGLNNAKASIELLNSMIDLYIENNNGVVDSPTSSTSHHAKKDLGEI